MGTDRPLHETSTIPAAQPVANPQTSTGNQCWLTPVATDQEQSAEDIIDTLVGRARIYAFSERAPGRTSVRPGDRICFYATGTGVVAHATVASLPEKRLRPEVRHPDDYPWTFTLTDTELYLDEPIVLDLNTRARLDAFTGRDPNRRWAWFVTALRRISAHDFSLLTRQDPDPHE